MRGPPFCTTIKSHAGGPVCPRGSAAPLRRGSCVGWAKGMWREHACHPRAFSPPGAHGRQCAAAPGGGTRGVATHAVAAITGAHPPLPGHPLPVQERPHAHVHCRRSCGCRLDRRRRRAAVPGPASAPRTAPSLGTRRDGVRGSATRPPPFLFPCWNQTLSTEKQWIGIWTQSVGVEARRWSLIRGERGPIRRWVRACLLFFHLARRPRWHAIPRPKPLTAAHNGCPYARAPRQLAGRGRTGCLPTASPSSAGPHGHHACARPAACPRSNVHG